MEQGSGRLPPSLDFGTWIRRSALHQGGEDLDAVPLNLLHDRSCGFLFGAYYFLGIWLCASAASTLRSSSFFSPVKKNRTRSDTQLTALFEPMA
jgi:hypothetical protein